MGRLSISERRHTQRAIVRAAHKLVARQQLLLVGSVVSAGVLLARRLDYGWFHHDDGSLAHSAERILAGELPHRDFTDLYTGLLSFLNAAIFAVMGHDMFNLRLPLFVLFLAFAACFFSLAHRIVGPFLAFAATLVAIGWSMPVYPAPIPSWYLLFLSTIGMYAIVRFFESDHRRWLLLAGACGGIAIAFKIAGVWYVVAVVLTLLVQPVEGQPETRTHAARSAKYTAVVIGSALLALLLAVVVVTGRPGAGELATLLLPIAALCGGIAVLGLRPASDRSARPPRGRP